MFIGWKGLFCWMFSTIKNSQIGQFELISRVAAYIFNHERAVFNVPLHQAAAHPVQINRLLVGAGHTNGIGQNIIHQIFSGQKMRLTVGKKRRRYYAAVCCNPL